MYARGMSQRDIAATIGNIYGFQMSHEQISCITGRVMEEGRGMAESSGSSRSIHLLSSTASTYRAHGYGVQQVAICVMLAYDVNGRDVLGLWINDGEQACLDADLRRAAGSRR